MLSRKQILVGLLALNISNIPMLAHGNLPREDKAQRVSLADLKSIGVVVWNTNTQKWEIDLVKLNDAIANKQIEVTPFDTHEIFTNDLNGPVAIGNW